MRLWYHSTRAASSEAVDEGKKTKGPRIAKESHKERACGRRCRAGAKGAATHHFRGGGGCANLQGDGLSILSDPGDAPRRGSAVCRGRAPFSLPPRGRIFC